MLTGNRELLVIGEGFAEPRTPQKVRGSFFIVLLIDQNPPIYEGKPNAKQ